MSYNLYCLMDFQLYLFALLNYQKCLFSHNQLSCPPPTEQDFKPKGILGEVSLTGISAIHRYHSKQLPRTTCCTVSRFIPLSRGRGQDNGGNRTHVNGFAGRSITILARRQSEKPNPLEFSFRTLLKYVCPILPP